MSHINEKFNKIFQKKQQQNVNFIIKYKRVWTGKGKRRPSGQYDVKRLRVEVGRTCANFPMKIYGAWKSLYNNTQKGKYSRHHPSVGDEGKKQAITMTTNIDTADILPFEKYVCLIDANKKNFFLNTPLSIFNNKLLHY